MATNFDYTSLLPGELKSTLQRLTKVYQDNSNKLNNAYLHTVLPGVYTSAPDIVHAKDIQFQVALRLFPSIRNFISYAELIDSLIPAIPDRDTLVSFLLRVASGWQKLDVSDLTALNKEYCKVFQSYLPKLDTILVDLQQFLDELVNIDKSNPPSWFHQTLFDTLRPILSFASFRDGVVGESSLAGILGVSLKMTSTPLNQVLFPFFPTSPDPKTVIAEAVQVHLVDAIEEYSITLKSLIPLFTTFSETYVVLSEEQAAVVPRILVDSPGTHPTTGEQCMTAWNGVKAVGTKFIDLLSGGGVGHLRVPSRRTPGDVTAAFGPPSGASTTLPEMSATTSQVIENFNKILSLPFIDTLKVTDIDGAETSVGYVMINCKRKYEKLQSTTVEIVRELNSYSILQDVVLPVVNAEDGLTLEQFLLTNLPIVMKYGKNAKKIAADTQALLIEFEEWLVVLNKNIDEINNSIEINKAALDDAQETYDSSKAHAILAGILGLAFTIGSITALSFGQGPLAVVLGMNAGASFAEMIYEAVNAGKLATVIGSFKKIISTSETTRSQLEPVIPLFRTIINLMGTIHTVWESISASLTDVQATYNLWNNPAYFTPEMIKGALSNWKEVNTQCEKYISIVAGQHPSFAKAFTSTGTPRALLIAGKEPPPPYEVAVLPGYERVLGKIFILDPADRVGKFKAMAQASGINSLTAALSPPFLTLGANRAELNDAANSYRQISALLNGVYNDSSNDAARLASTITSSLIPSLNKAIEFYIKFADGQEDPFAKGTSVSAMERLIAERWKELKEGSSLAKAAETVYLKFRFDSQAALNTLNRHVNELYQQLAAKDASLRDLQADYDKWSWYWPSPPGVGTIIYLIIDSIKQTTKEINKLRNDIYKLNSTRVYVIRVQKMLDDVGRTTSTLSQSWSELTTKTNNLQSLVYAVVINPAVEQAVRPVVKANWEVFRNDLKQW